MKTTIYFTNDTLDMIQGKVEELKSGYTGCIEDDEWDKESVFDSMCNFFSSSEMTNKEDDEKARKLLHAIHVDCDMDSPENEDTFTALLDLMVADDKSLAFLAKEYEDYLYNNGDIITTELDYERENANELLTEDGFAGKNEPYIILGFNMGWRHRNGYIVTQINSLEDLEESITGNYDYTITLKREEENPYLQASVATHDADTGESYFFCPISRIKEALEHSDFAEAYNKFMPNIDLYIEEETATT